VAQVITISRWVGLAKFWFRTLKKVYILGDLGVNERIIMKWILNKYGRVWSASYWLKIFSIANNQHFRFNKRQDFFFEKLSDSQFLKDSGRKVGYCVLKSPHVTNVHIWLSVTTN
jgi:hypothetical protein